MVTELNPDALSIAATLDSERASGTSRGPLHGIPILIKNNIATDDKMNNTAGSYALLGSKVPSDSTMAAKLRKAGAVLLGKTNLSQWANYRSDNTSNGWSAYGGQTEGAYFPGQDPSGSSAGSGVASSLGLASGCLGTETDGSILSPSNQNNLVGIKPTVGLTSRYLVIPISEHQDTVGPMTRTVKDAAHILTAIAGQDANDNYTSAMPFNKTPSYIDACQLDALRGKRIGVPRNYIDLTGQEYYAPTIPVFNAALDVLREAGATVVDNITLPGYDVLAEANYPNVVLEADFNTDLAKYLSELVENPHNIKTVSDLQNFTQGFPLEDWPERDTLVWTSAIELGYGNDSPLFWSNYTAGLFYAGPLGITGALQNYSLDALVVPTPFSPFLPALLGAPVVTVPLGALPPNTTVQLNGFGNLNASAPNLPYGLSFMGARFDEYNLIGLAYAFEQRTLVRNTIRPYIEPTTELVDVVGQRKMGLKV
ncbi:amidase signature enzyme [Cryphonectria parasitica EP155]|uniref:Amidase signature enzyme n=1 Tax=Cryphonectria parasitica (strain ATCC 38755 / EP155) TaxID=660469 RepID=A0A9P4Y0M5_CRYP1|nr:amidase signature enzyme [Cryphonectria parasitica EP155]KAF3764348.1 amidase signature enzyme [Cryphonectria parasitica EP155]